MAQTLLAAGLTPEQVARMLFVPDDSLSAGERKDETAAGDSSQENPCAGISHQAHCAKATRNFCPHKIQLQPRDFRVLRSSSGETFAARLHRAGCSYIVDT